MGIWDVYCVICGGPTRNDFKKGTYLSSPKGEMTVQKTITKYNWLDKLVLISSTEEVINTTSGDYNDSGEFELDINYVVAPLNWPSGDDFDDTDTDEREAVLCHKACYNYLKAKLGYTLKFSDICRLLSTSDNFFKNKSGYGLNKKYFSQFYDYYGAYNENSWLLEEPTKNKENGDRILDMWKPLAKKFKSKGPRPSPCRSATEFKSGTVKVGYDGNLWTVSKNKWIRYYEDSTDSS